MEGAIQKEFKSLEIDEVEESEVKPCITIWFDAWAYGNTEQIWSGLAESIIQRLPRVLVLYYGYI
jgi:hypothetical protein